MDSFTASLTLIWDSVLGVKRRWFIEAVVIQGYMHRVPGSTQNVLFTNAIAFSEGLDPAASLLPDQIPNSTHEATVLSVCFSTAPVFSICLSVVHSPHWISPAGSWRCPERRGTHRARSDTVKPSSLSCYRTRCHPGSGDERNNKTVGVRLTWSSCDWMHFFRKSKNKAGKQWSLCMWIETELENNRVYLLEGWKQFTPAGIPCPSKLV